MVNSEHFVIVLEGNSKFACFREDQRHRFCSVLRSEISVGSRF